MAYRLSISQQADRDADAIYAFIANDSVSRAAKWYRGLLEAIESLRENALLHGFAPERATMQIDLRQMLYGRRRHVYRILYLVEDDTVVVLHIRHAAQRLLDE